MPDDPKRPPLPIPPDPTGQTRVAVPSAMGTRRTGPAAPLSGGAISATGSVELDAPPPDLKGADDASATIPVPKLDGDPATPPPLPPSPAHAAAQHWLEDDAPTRPAALADFDSFSRDEKLPGPSVAAETVRHVKLPSVELAPASKRLLALTAATSLAVGVVLGALLFRGRGGPPAAPAPAVDPPAVIRADAAPRATPTPAVARLPDAAPPEANLPRCRLSVASTPPGADVTIDGRAYGPTPVDIADAPCGEVDVTVDKGVEGRWERRVRLAPDQPAAVEAPLRRAAPTLPPAHPKPPPRRR